MVIQGSRRDRKYLGQYYNLFESISAFEARIPTWQALGWILKNYGMFHIEDISWDLEYKSLVDATWIVEAPPSVVMNSNFCKCPRRHKWRHDALIDWKAYNWSIILGKFKTSVDCTESYAFFFKTHKEYTNPICFRAAIFANFLAKIYGAFYVIINVNEFNHQNPKFWVHLKV